MKSGLLIQGPVFSSGRTGKSLGPHQNQTSIVHFDSRDYIVKSYFLGSKFFDTVLVILWDEDAWWITESGIPPSNFLVLNGPSQENTSDSLASFKNKYRQYLACYEGLAWLSTHGCEVFAKSRSDQSLDLQLLSRATRSINKKYDMLFPNIQNMESMYFEDFYFCGRTDYSLELFRSLMYENEISQNTHTDIFFHILKLARTGYVRKLSSNLHQKYFDATVLPIIKKLPTGIRKAVFAECVFSHIGVVDQEIWEGLEWRGEKIPNLTSAKMDTAISRTDLNISFKVHKFLGNFLLFWLIGNGYNFLNRIGFIKLEIFLRGLQIGKKLDTKKREVSTKK